MSDLKSFNHEHQGVNYVFKYQVDEHNQQCHIRGIFLPAHPDNIIAVVDPEIIKSAQEHINTTHLTHSA